MAFELKGQEIFRRVKERVFEAHQRLQGLGQATTWPKKTEAATGGIGQEVRMALPRAWIMTWDVLSTSPWPSRPRGRGQVEWRSTSSSGGGRRGGGGEGAGGRPVEELGGSGE